MCKRVLLNLVYKRRNSNSILAVVGKSKIGGSFRLSNCSAPNLVNKRRNSTSLLSVGLENNRNCSDSGGSHSYGCSAENNKSISGDSVSNNSFAPNWVDSSSLPLVAGLENEKNGSVGGLSYNCSAPNLVYKRRKAASLPAEAKRESNSNGGGGCLIHNSSIPVLVYKRRNSNSFLTAAGVEDDRQGSGCFSHNSTPTLVYKRRNSTNLLAEAGQGNNTKICGGSLTYNCSSPTIVYKRKNSTSFLSTKGGKDNCSLTAAGTSNCSTPILVYKRRKSANFLATARWENKENSCGGCSSYRSSAPTIVYKRRNSTNCLAAARKENKENNSGSCLSCISSVPNLVYKRRKTTSPPTAELKINKAGSGKGLCCRSSEMPSMSQTGNDSYTVGEDLVSASRLCNHDLTGKENSSLSEQVSPKKFDVAPCTKYNKPRSLEISAKTINMGCFIGAVKEIDEAQNNVQKSASDILTTNQLGTCSTEKELIYKFLRDVLPQRVCSSRKSVSNDAMVSNSAAKSCKICDGLEDSQNMLICDNCEEAFHVSCCSPKVRKIPVDEWYCQPCSKKQNRLPRKSLNAKCKASKGKKAAPMDPIGSMLRDPEPYTTGVRIGKDFQADVPDWSGPVSSDVDFFGKELDPTECDTSRDLNANKTPARSSAGNWLQCKEVLVDNTEVEIICGKWRRAPLFEIQTDDWDCSCALPWDPVHADCAVPQEIPTDQVLKQLKYIEMLRTKLVSKKQKLTHTEGDTDNVKSVA